MGLHVGHALGWGCILVMPLAWVTPPGCGYMLATPLDWATPLGCGYIVATPWVRPHPLGVAPCWPRPLGWAVHIFYVIILWFFSRQTDISSIVALSRGQSSPFPSSLTGPDVREYQFAVNNDTTEFYVKELPPHTAYTFYVVAYSPMGASRPSLPVTVTMLEDGEEGSGQVSHMLTS